MSIISMNFSTHIMSILYVSSYNYELSFFNIISDDDKNIKNFFLYFSCIILKDSYCFSVN